MKKKINIREIVPWVALILALAWLVRTCNEKQKPVYMRGKDIEKIVQVHDKINERLYDSFKTVIAGSQDSARRWKLKFEDLMTDYLNDKNDFQAQLSTPVPDTCKPYQKALTDRYNQLAKRSEEKDQSARGAIQALEKVGKDKDAFLKAKDSMWASLRRVTDTCISALKTAEKQGPRRSIWAGSEIIGNENNFFYGIGVNLAYQTKKGTQFELGVLQIKSTTQYSLGVKIRLAKF